MPIPNSTLISSGSLLITSMLLPQTTSNITVNGGTLILGGTAGALNSSYSGTLTINQGGTVTLDNTTANVANRIPTSANVAINGGVLNIKGNITSATSANLGKITLGVGASTIAAIENGAA